MAIEFTASDGLLHRLHTDEAGAVIDELVTPAPAPQPLETTGDD
jgi:hypothetical protein